MNPANRFSLPEAAGRPLTGSETILLVEDEESLRGLAARILRDRGYKVLESTSPEDALQISGRHNEPIDLLLTDVVMPMMSGRKIAEHLAFLRPSMRVLYMSGYTDDSVVRHGVLEPGPPFSRSPLRLRLLPARYAKSWMKSARRGPNLPKQASIWLYFLATSLSGFGELVLALLGIGPEKSPSRLPSSDQ